MRVNVLYTYGYNQGNPALLVRMAEAGVLIVDVRFRAASRRPVFAKSNLEKLLGYRYTHLPALGNQNYQEGGEVVLRHEESGLMDLQAFVEMGPTCILCACWNVAVCHRLAVAEKLFLRMDGQLAIVHLDPAEIGRRWPLSRSLFPEETNGR